MPVKIKMAEVTVVRAVVAVICDMLIEELREIQKKYRKSRKRRVWTREWIKRRDNLGASTVLLREIANEDPSTYKNHLRMSIGLFEELLEKIKGSVT